MRLPLVPSGHVGTGTGSDGLPAGGDVRPAVGYSTWSFLHLGYVRVQAVVLETNLRSERVLAKSLFSYEGLLRSYRMVRGRPRDFKMYARISPLP